MPLNLSSKLVYLARDEWDDSGAPRLGGLLNNLEAVEAIQHHTVGIDNDATPNQWPSLGAVKDRMRFLRTVRPDLGEDIPYSWVGFLMEHHVLGHGGMIVCEGRGPDRRGAHTRYHNRTGRALALDGNFEDYAIDLLPWVPQLSRAWSFFKFEQGLPNLGTSLPERGEIWPHGEFPTASTACPGQYVKQVLRGVWMTPPDEEDEMALWLVKEAGSQFTYVSNGIVRTYVDDPVALAELQQKQIWPTDIITLSSAAMQQLARVG